MSNGYKMTKEVRNYAQRVYGQMHGFYKKGTVPKVSEEKVLEKHYEEIYNALERLGNRCGFDVWDEDREALLNAVEDILQESSIKMFEYGMKYAQGKM